VNIVSAVRRDGTDRTDTHCARSGGGDRIWWVPGGNVSEGVLVRAQLGSERVEVGTKYFPQPEGPSRIILAK
jgi:hypothetical protein